MDESNIKHGIKRSTNGATDFDADKSFGVRYFKDFSNESPPRQSLTICGELTILGVERTVLSLDKQQETKRDP